MTRPFYWEPKYAWSICTVIEIFALGRGRHRKGSGGWATTSVMRSYGHVTLEVSDRSSTMLSEPIFVMQPARGRYPTLDESVTWSQARDWESKHGERNCFSSDCRAPVLDTDPLRRTFQFLTKNRLVDQGHDGKRFREQPDPRSCSSARYPASARSGVYR